MKLCRFQVPEIAADDISQREHQTHPNELVGIVEGHTVAELSGELWGPRDRTGRTWDLSAIRLLPPTRPSKIVCMGRNYVEHAAEMGAEPPKQPVIFLKPPSSVIGPEEPIVMPRLSERVEYEGEIAVVVGRRCRLERQKDARPYILGYTCFNDVTARDLQRLDGQWTRGKSFDTFCPFGPVVETDLNLQEAQLETYVNGEKRQSARGREMIFSMDVILNWIAQVMTLEPGDVIATGTPSGVGRLKAGDVVEVSVSGIGTLRNPVVALPAAPGES
jgi:2-keto-4-pentenoate hydratase/2-oxohepta-3-ene-1,7-dioic acid hydratase in catechol pathway